MVRGLEHLTADQKVVAFKVVCNFKLSFNIVILLLIFFFNILQTQITFQNFQFFYVHKDIFSVPLKC